LKAVTGLDIFPNTTVHIFYGDRRAWIQKDCPKRIVGSATLLSSDTSWGKQSTCHAILQKLMRLQLHANLTIRNARITEVDIKLPDGISISEEKRINSTLLEKAIHEIGDWTNLLGNTETAKWFNVMLGVPKS
jgi:hypothetical protein